MIRRTVVLLLVAFASGIPEPVEGQDGRYEWSFGVLEGADREILGDVAAVSVGPDGHVFIADGQKQGIAWLDLVGELQAWFGSEGEGPREFGTVASLAVLSDGRIVVGDTGRRRLVILQRDGAELEISEEHRLAFFPRALCTLDDRLFVMAYHEGRVLHEVSSEGKVLESFGSPLDFPSEVPSSALASYSASGHLTCVPEREMVITVPRLLPEVRAFSAEGELIWTHVLEPFTRVHITGSAATYTMAANPETGSAHLNESLWSSDGEVIGVHLSEAKSGEYRSRPTELRLLDAENGQLVARHQGTPRIAWVSEGWYLAWESSPIPRVFMTREIPFEN